jgi:hypothetical protein
MKKVIKLTESDLTKLVKRVINESSDQSGDLYSSINDLIDNFEGIDESEIIMVLESILAHHKGKEGRRKRNVGYLTSDEVRRNFNR